MRQKLKSKFQWGLAKDLPSLQEMERLSERFQKAVTGKAKPLPRLRKTRDSSGEWQRWDEG